MANKFTRTVKTFEAKAYQLQKEGGEIKTVLIGSVVYSAASDAESHARKAFKDNGFYVPRGCKIIIDCIGTKKFALSIDEFMQYAHEVED